MLPTTQVSPQVFSIMDTFDDKAVMAEIEGRVGEKWVYHFKADGKELWGMGKLGVDQAAIHLAKKGYLLREISVECIPDPNSARHFLFTARVQKVAMQKDGQQFDLEVAIGVKRVATKILLKAGGSMDDPHWYEKGCAKALRNAKLKLIPDEVTSKIIAIAKKGNKVQEIKPDEVVTPASTTTPNEQNGGVEAEAPAVPSFEPSAVGETLKTQNKSKKPVLAKCGACDVDITTASVVEYSKKKFNGLVFCYNCQKTASV